MSFLREGAFAIHSVFLSPLEVRGSRIIAQIGFITYEGVLKFLVFIPRKPGISFLAYALRGGHVRKETGYTTEGSEEANRPSSLYHAEQPMGGKNHKAIYPGWRWRCGETCMDLVHARVPLRLASSSDTAPSVVSRPCKTRTAPQCTPGKE